VNRWGARIFIDQTLIDHPFWRLYPDLHERQWASTRYGHARGLTKPPPHGGRGRQPPTWTVTKSTPWWRQPSPGGAVNPFAQPPDPKKLGAGLVAVAATGIPGLALIATAIAGPDKGGNGMTAPGTTGTGTAPAGWGSAGTQTPGGNGGAAGGGSGGGNSSIGKAQGDMLASNEKLQQATQAVQQAAQKAKEGQQAGQQAMKAIEEAEQAHRKAAADSKLDEPRKRQQIIQKMKQEQAEANQKWAQIVKEQEDVVKAAGVATESGKTIAGKLW
jgi:hypothetical protein